MQDLRETEDMRSVLRLPKRPNSREEQQIPKAVFQLRKALRNAPGRAKVRSYQKGRGSVRSSTFAARPQLQRVAVRITYAKNKRKGGHWKAHGRYLEREGPQKEGEKALGFGCEGNDLQISQTLCQWEQTNDPHIFKIIISPEFGEKIDLQKHCREMVSQMETDLSTKLEWIAVEHFNTDNPHVHLCIRGRDEKGNPLQLSRDYIKMGARQRAAEVATAQLGYRTAQDVAEAAQRQITQQRFTELDRMLLKNAQLGKIVFEGVIPQSLKARELRLNLIQRLTQLTSMGLAKKVGSKTWQLNPNLESALRQIQISGDRLKTLFQHRMMVSDPRAQLIASELKEPGQSIAGRVVGCGLDERANKPYILIESFDGKVHYLAQSSQMESMRGQGKLKSGNMVLLEVTVSPQGKPPCLSVNDYGPTFTPELLDKNLIGKALYTATSTSLKTLSGAYQAAAEKRLAVLLKEGGVEIHGNIPKIVDAIKYERVRFPNSRVQLIQTKQDELFHKSCLDLSEKQKLSLVTQDADSGFSVTGKIILMKNFESHTKILLHSGEKLLILTQQNSHKLPIREGQMITARSNHIRDFKTNTNIATWTFLDAKTEINSQIHQKERSK
jgi:type IV secretory pathway VirD2 relaxase